MTAKSKAANAAKKAYRSTEHLPKYKPQGWGYYSPKTTNPAELTKDELAKVVRKAAKAANQRLRSLERQGLSVRSGAYKYAQSQLPQTRPRFRERVTADMDQTTLRHMYMQLRNFISYKTSTPTGMMESQAKGYETAKRQGFTGSAEDWEHNNRKYWQYVREGLLSSDVAYQAMVDGNTDIIDEQIEFWRTQGHRPDRGESLNDYLDRLERKGLI